MWLVGAVHTRLFPGPQTPGLSFLAWFLLHAIELARAHFSLTFSGECASGHSVWGKGVTMGRRFTLSVAKMLGSDCCIGADDAAKIFRILCRMIRRGDSVTLSFKGIRLILPVFLSFAIAMVYDHFSEGRVNAAVVVTDISEADLRALARVIQQAKGYREDPEFYDQAFADCYEDVEENKCDPEDHGFIVGRNEDDSDVLEDGLEEVLDACA